MGANSVRDAESNLEQRNGSDAARKRQAGRDRSAGDGLMIAKATTA